jgi:hypothetical protein
MALQQHYNTADIACLSIINDPMGINSHKNKYNYRH